jgi:hypothetical protein
MRGRKLISREINFERNLLEQQPEQAKTVKHLPHIIGDWEVKRGHTHEEI